MNSQEIIKRYNLCKLQAIELEIVNSKVEDNSHLQKLAIFKDSRNSVHENKFMYDLMDQET